MESIILTSPALIIICLVAAALHIVEAILGGKLWLSIVNLVAHMVGILLFLYFEATLLDLFIFLMFTTAVCLALRARRNTK